MTNQEIFTDARIDMLTMARVALWKMHEELSWRGDYSSGMVSARCEVAADAIFDVLNHANAHFEDVDIPDEVLIKKQLINGA